VVSGLWHGANWTFVIWGALHGIYQIIEIWKKNLISQYTFLQQIKIPKTFAQLSNILITFILVYISWIFFRANNVNDAFFIIQNLFNTDPQPVNLFFFKADMTISLITIAFLLIIELWEEVSGLYDKITRFPKFIKWIILTVILLSIVILGKWDEVDFLYFQF